ncbi:transposase, partial [Enterococcus faecalis]|nr:transposase [Enterococcus faecalis]
SCNVFKNILSLECLNNHIKVLKRNAYGFRNFYNFKLCILVQQRQALHTK